MWRSFFDRNVETRENKQIWESEIWITNLLHFKSPNPIVQYGILISKSKVSSSVRHWEIRTWTMKPRDSQLFLNDLGFNMEIWIFNLNSYVPLIEMCWDKICIGRVKLKFFMNPNIILTKRWLAFKINKTFVKDFFLWRRNNQVLCKGWKIEAQCLNFEMSAKKHFIKLFVTGIYSFLCI